MHWRCFGYIIVGAAGYVDRVVLGPSHLYQSPTCKEIYDTKIPYDPEGNYSFWEIHMFLNFFDTWVNCAAIVRFEEKNRKK